MRAFTNFPHLWQLLQALSAAAKTTWTSTSTYNWQGSKHLIFNEDASESVSRHKTMLVKYLYAPLCINSFFQTNQAAEHLRHSWEWNYLEHHSCWSAQTTSQFQPFPDLDWSNEPPSLARVKNGLCLIFSGKKWRDCGLDLILSCLILLSLDEKDFVTL